jgi:SAM-dependent methyltransferase
MTADLYQTDLAYTHDAGFGFHGDRCAPGILARLEPVLGRGGTVLELGCGTGALTRHLVSAGHRVIATDASPAMLARARRAVPGAAQVRQLVLPGDPLPPVDAVVCTGHVLNYLTDTGAVHQALSAIAGSLRPGGMLALDVADLAWLAAPQNARPLARVGTDWAVFCQPSTDASDRLVHAITTFVRTDPGAWRRADERHEILLLDTALLPELLARYGVDAAVCTSFGAERLRPGLVALVGERR